MNEPKSDRNFLEATGEGIEAFLDLALENEAVKAVPIVGTAVKLLKGADDIRSRIFVEKIRRFLTAVDLTRSRDTEEIRARLGQDASYAEKVGETSFLVLDKVSDMDKPAMLGRAFAAFLDERVEGQVVLLLVHAVEMAFIGDLQEFLSDAPDPNDNLWRNRLGSAGLLEEIKDESWSSGVSEYDPAPLGSTFLEVMRDVPRTP